MKKKGNIKHWQGCKAPGNSHAFLIQSKMIQLLWKNTLAGSSKAFHTLLYDQANPLVSIYSGEISKRHANTKIYMWMFIAALVNIAKC